MSSTFTSFVRRVSNQFTPSSSRTDLSAKPEAGNGGKPCKFSKALEGALFEKTTPEADGEECLHDCSSCTIRYPSKFKVDEDAKLYGEVKGWSRHLLVATGKSDWVRDVADEKGSVMEAVDQVKGKIEDGRLMLSASNIPTPACDSDYSKPTRVLLLPAFTWVENVSPDSVSLLVTHIINSAPTTMTPLSATTPPSSILHNIPSPTPSPEPAPPLPFTTRQCNHRAVILLCSQRTRDARCGQSAPLLRREFERHLRPLGLHRDSDDDRPGGVGIYFISHVGGHKFSANVMVYRRREKGEIKQGEEGKDEGAAQCIWLARVRPDECENIVRYTVLQGKVVKPEKQLRGGFDREKGLVSWCKKSFWCTLLSSILQMAPERETTRLVHATITHTVEGTEQTWRMFLPTAG